MKKIITEGSGIDLEEILSKAQAFFDAGNLNRFIRRIQIYSDKLVAIDFRFRGVRFAFDVAPEANLTTSVYALQRSHFDELFLLENRRRKRRLANEVLVGEALQIVDAEARRYINKIKQRLQVTSLANQRPETSLEYFYNAKNVSSSAKKVGIMTLPLSKNIGGNLQAYALKHALCELGHMPMLINRRIVPKSEKSAIEKNLKDDSGSLFADSIGINASLPNAKFIEANIKPISRVFADSASLKDYFPQYNLDAVIVGSDQVWRPKYAKSILNDMFLQFILDTDSRVRRISYAASFGASKWEYDEEQTKAAARLVKRFNHVSVREDDAVLFCQENFGVRAQHVLDPTMLLTQEHYAQKFSLEASAPQDKRLLAYVLDMNNNKAGLIREVANTLELAPYFTDGRKFVFPDSSNTLSEGRTVEGWLSSLYHSSFVITDSFHGTVFAILFNKPFIAYGNPARGMSRFTSLLKMLGLEDRLVINPSVSDLEMLLQPIDWTDVNSRVSVARNSSMTFLREALESQEGEVSPIEANSHGNVPVTASWVESGVKVNTPYARNVMTLSQIDCQRFLKAHEKKKNDYTAAQSRLMYSTHAVEKGLSRINFRSGFGEKAISRLAKEMESWLKAGRPRDDAFFEAAASVMRSYFERHEQLSFDTSGFKAMFTPELLGLIADANPEPGGVLPADAYRETIANVPDSRSFLDVMYGRRSIRDFTQVPISDTQIHNAVQIAMQAPSVCNRQSVRFHYFKDQGTIEKLVDIQGGFGGYKKPPGLCLVTAELTAFLNGKERNQGFIDGGLFLMAFLLGLEQVGLGACPLNTAMDVSKDIEVRKVLTISETEVLIAFVAVGNYEPGVLIPRSKRLPVSAVLSVHD